MVKKTMQLSEFRRDYIITDKSIQLMFNSFWVLFFLVVSQFKPQSIIGLADYTQSVLFISIERLWTITQVSTFLSLLIVYLRRFKVHSFNVFFLITMFHISIISYLNNSHIGRIGTIVIPPISVVLMIELAYNYKVFDKLIIAIYTYFGGLIILNYISMLIYPDSFYTDYRGMDVTWIFGNYQQNLNWFVVFIAISFYASTILDKRFKYINLFTYIIIIITTIKVWSATTMVALGVIFGLIIFERFIGTYDVINIFFAYLTGIITTILIVVYQVQEYFTFFIEGVLQKSVNFTGRMRLWENTVSYILKKPFFGQGVELSTITFEKIGKTTAHNHYLNLTYNGGFVYLFLTIILVYLVSKKIKNYRETTSIIFVNSAIIGYFVYFLAEAKINLNIFMFLLSITYYLSATMEEKDYEQITTSRI